VVLANSEINTTSNGMFYVFLPRVIYLASIQSLVEL